MFETIGTLAQTGFAAILSPVRTEMAGFGLHPTDLQAWAFVVALFMVVVAVPGVYGDIMLTRRRQHTTGRVVAIDVDNDGMRTPVIEFRDASKAIVRFNSPLPATGATATVGAAVPIIYDPLRPSRAREMGRPVMKFISYLFWWAMAIAVLLYAIGVIQPS